MKVDFAVIADYAAVTGDGKLIVAGIFDRIIAPELPSVHATMSVAMQLEGDIGISANHRVDVSFLAPNGSEVMPSFEGEVRLLTVDSGSSPGAQFILALPGVRFEQYGRYRIEIRVDGELLRTISLYVVAPSGPPMMAM